MPFPKREAPRRPSLDSWSGNGGMLSCSIFIASRWMTSCQSVGELWNRPPFSEDGHLSADVLFRRNQARDVPFPMAMQQKIQTWHMPNWNSSSRCVTAKLRFFMLVTTSFRKTPSKLQNLSGTFTFSNHGKSPSFLVNTVKILDFLWVESIRLLWILVLVTYFSHHDSFKLYFSHRFLSEIQRNWGSWSSEEWHLGSFELMSFGLPTDSNVHHNHDEWMKASWMGFTVSPENCHNA